MDGLVPLPEDKTSHGARVYDWRTDQRVPMPGVRRQAEQPLVAASQEGQGQHRSQLAEIMQQYAMGRMIGQAMGRPGQIAQASQQVAQMGQATGQATQQVSGMGKAAGAVGAAIAAVVVGMEVYKRAMTVGTAQIRNTAQLESARMLGDYYGEARAKASRPSAWEAVPGVGEIARINRDQRTANVERLETREGAAMAQASRLRAFSPQLVQSSVQAQMIDLGMRQRMAGQMGPQLAEFEQAKALRDAVQQQFNAQRNVTQARNDTRDNRRVAELMGSAMLSGNAKQTTDVAEAVKKLQQGSHGDFNKLHKALEQNAEKMEAVRKLLQEIGDQAETAATAEEVAKAFDFGSRVRHHVPADPVMDNAGMMPPIQPAF